MHIYLLCLGQMTFWMLLLWVLLSLSNFCSSHLGVINTRFLIRVYTTTTENKAIVRFEPKTAARHADALPLSYMTPFCSSNFCYVYIVVLILFLLQQIL
jgi:hypothetical protein